MGDTQSRSIINVHVRNFPGVPMVPGSRTANINKTKPCVLQEQLTGKTDCKFFTKQNAVHGMDTSYSESTEERNSTGAGGGRHEGRGGGSIRIESYKRRTKISASNNRPPRYMKQKLTD